MTKDKLENTAIAILASDDKKIKVLGYGLITDEIPNLKASKYSFMAKCLRKHKTTNPCITVKYPEHLKGRKVYGCECWWAKVSKYELPLRFKGLEVEYIDIDEYRKQEAE